MNLVISSRAGVERFYGTSGFTAVRAALDDYVSSTAASVLALVDDAESMALLGLEPMPATASGSVLGAIRSIHRLLPAIDSIFIVGNDHIVPYWQFANPVTDRGVDPDWTVYSDNPYGALADTFDAYVAPGLAVGRLPDALNGTLDDFVAAIAACAANHRHRRFASGSAAVVNAEWFEATRAVIASLSPPVSAWPAPGFQLGASNRSDIDRAYLYFNLHGFAADPAWKGFDDRRGQFFTVATPDSFDRAEVNGSIVFAENCYGALTAGKTLQSSCALKLVREGAAAVVGATGLAFGSHIAPNALLENADLLAKQFFTHACAGIGSVGAALVSARDAYRRDGTTSAANAFKQKTLLQFTLLGDPSLN
jgi:hypothetical protein